MASAPLTYLNNSVREIGFRGGAILTADPVVRRGPVDAGGWVCHPELTIRKAVMPAECNHGRGQIEAGSHTLQIWVDADACPRVIKEILYRAAERVKIKLTLVANRTMHVPRSEYLSLICVPHGFDEADHRIVELMQAGDLVITGDIPLAAAVVEQGGHVLGPRGEQFTEENIQERLAMRDLMDQLRSEGMETGGPAALGKSDRQVFANGLDQLLTRYVQASGD